MLNHHAITILCRRLGPLLALMIVGGMLVGCGQSGELRHPDAPETEQPAGK